MDEKEKQKLFDFFRFLPVVPDGTSSNSSMSRTSFKPEIYFPCF